MTQLLEEQWELDGFLFGGLGATRTNVVVLQDGLDMGSASVRAQDAERPGANGLLMGRDYLGAPEVQLTMGVLDDADVWSVIAGLTQAWRPATNRRPGAMSVLRYRRNGVTWRYYGRPRKFAVKATAKKNDTFQTVDASFQLAEPIAYREADVGTGGGNSVTLQLIASTSDGGLILPAKVPFELRSGSQSRQGGAVVAAAVDSPFEVVINGPVAGALSEVAVSGDGWRIASSTTVASGQTLRIDTRMGTIQLDGADIPGSLSHDSRLNARLHPGAQQLSFTGSDPTNTARATITWYAATPL